MKLQPLLTEYLMEHGSLPLTDIGHLSIIASHAYLQDKALLLNPPVTKIIYNPKIPQPAEEKPLIEFIGNRLHLSNEQAAALVKQEGNFQKVFSENEIFNWTAVGIFRKKADGTVSFSQEESLNNYLPSLQPQTVQHQSEIESDQEQQPEMVQEIFDKSEKIIKLRWWVWAIIIFIFSIGLILFHSLNATGK